MKFAIVGYGKMSSAIARAAQGYLVRQGIELFVFTPSPSSAQRAREELTNAHVLESLDDLCQKADLILFGVKPQKMSDLLKENMELLQGKSVLSIAAGLTSQSLQRILGDTVRLQRVMPNLGVAVSQGMTLVSEETTLLPSEREFVLELFASIGKVKILPESLMDIGSVLSGSSGAFYTVFLEALAEAGLRRGLSYQDAMVMTLQTHLGTISLLQQGLGSSQLRIDTSSPAGTTIEGVIALEEGALRNAVHRAVEASYHRCEELAEK